MQPHRPRPIIALLAGLLVLVGVRSDAPPKVPPPPKPAITPAKPAPAPKPEPPPRPSPWGTGSGRRSASGIVEAGYDGPDGRRVMVEFPTEFWKANVTSRGQGCCVFRSIDFASHWQNVPALWGFPEWIQKKGLTGGGYSGNVTERISAICKERGVPEPGYVNAETKQDYALLKTILATGRLAVVTYSGSDGVHYNGGIAHMVCLAYADDEMVAVLDNNFPPDKLLWMPAAEFKKRWSGWVVALVAPRPPAAPWN